MNPRTPIDELELTASPNLGRAIKREAADAKLPALDEQQLSEVEKLDALVEKVMRACAHGSTVGGKSNPAFRQLQILVKVRSELTRGKKPPAKRSALLDEVNKLLETKN